MSDSLPSQNPGGAAELDSFILNEVQLLLAEKRTAMSVMRTGIAIFALPLSVLSVLIATSRFYDVLNVMHLLVPLGVLNLALIVLGAYLILHALRRIRHYDRLIAEFKRKHSKLAELVD
ncbi:MAG: hypothetical protein HY301_01255 [Verrucomicrobia bacterium]|nr:hypothetical protein [Verrucomicrobiota bacterium]